MKKKLTTTLLLLCALFFLMGCKKIKNEGVVIKNCSGYFLRINDLDYKVCNFMSLNPYNSGVSIKVKYRIVDHCSNNQVVCTDIYPYADIIEILKVE